jgi:hypothetical protein
MSLRTQYRCGTPERRARVRDADPARGERILNGIDFLEVASDDQRTLEITFIGPLPGETGGVPASPALTIDDVVIEGGVRVVDVQVTQVSASDNVLTVEVDRAGDFSTYVLRLVAGGPVLRPRMASIRCSLRSPSRSRPGAGAISTARLTRTARPRLCLRRSSTIWRRTTPASGGSCSIACA